MSDNEVWGEEGSCREEKVCISEEVVDSNSDFRIRDVSEGEVVLTSVWIITKSNSTVKTYGLGSLSATPFPGSGGGAHVGLKIPASTT